MEETEAFSNWGTWEELVLGGAVLRHGIRDWNAIATELRSRTFYPYYFTPEVCKAKYQDLQARYSGCTAWFEELRKKRVAELKRELEKSQGSIGSLESKLESLKSEKNEAHNSVYKSGHTESPPSVGNLSRPESDYPHKETTTTATTTTSKDGFSAGSFTEETQTDSSPEGQLPAIRPVILKTEDGQNATSKETILKKRRGKRKRKDCGLRPAMSVDREESTGDCAVDLMSILNSIIESQNLSSVFQKRTDSQRRGKYKKTVRQHMDLNIIRSRISDRSIVSTKELYRDLLLLCNNAIVFYSRDSRENKAAHSLRDFVTKNFWQNVTVYRTQNTTSTTPPPEKPSCNPPEKPKCNPPVKPRSVRPNHPKVAKAVVVEESKKGFDTEIPVESKEVVGKKRVVDKPVKVGRSGGSKRVENSVNGGRNKVRKK